MSKGIVRGLPTRYTALDIETTGLYPQRGARIIEVGAVLVENGTIVTEFQSLIDCGKKIPASVQKVHRITNDLLIGQPRPDEVFPAFLSFISGTTLVAHNAAFDITFLRYELARLGLGITNRYLCTLKICKKQFPELTNHKLETVARHLLGGLPEGYRPHRALDDARLTARVWLELQACAGDLGGD